MHRAEPRPPPAPSRATRLLLLSLLLVTTLPSAAQSRRQDDLTVAPATATLAVGQTLQLAVTNAAGAVTWSSNDTTVATVSAGGLVTARNPGDGAARIYAKYKSQRGWCDVTVTAGAVPAPTPTNQAPTAVISDPAEDVSITEGQVVSFVGTGTDADGTVTGYTWQFPGGTPDASGVAAPGSVTYAAAGEYVASLRVQDDDGADSEPATRRVTVAAATQIPPPPPAAPSSVSLIGPGTQTMVDNPTAVQFAPSADHGTLDRYERRTVHVSSASVLESADIGVPTPSGGLCQVTISLNAWAADEIYRVEVRAVRSGLSSAWVASAQTGRKVTAPPPPSEDAFYVSLTGNNANAGTEASPWRTLAFSIPKLSPGKTLYIRAGTWTETINSGAFTIPAGTSFASPVTIAAYPGETVLIRPTTVATGQRVVNLAATSIKYVVFDGIIFDGINGINTGGGGNSYVVQLISGGYTRWVDVEIRNGASNGFYISPNDAGHHEFINCSVHDNGLKDQDVVDAYGHGFYVQSSYNLIEDSDVYGNGAYGIQLYSGFTAAVIQFNIIRRTKIHGNGVKDGGSVVLGGQNNEFYNNLSYANSGQGVMVHFKSPNGNKVYFNTLYGNANYGIYVHTDAVGTIVRDNISYGNTQGGFSNNGTSTTRSHNLGQSGCEIVANPLLVNAAGANFHLQSGSPAINAGLAIAGITTDFAGTTRGTPPEIGAYEF